MNKKKNERKQYHIQTGITLVALVITIVVLLILSGITITMLFDENGIIKKAQDAKVTIENAQADTINELKNLQDEVDEILGKVKIPDGLEVGSEVSYSPSGTYNWQAAYCSAEKTPTIDDVMLNSSEGKDFYISSWKVLSIDNITGNITLVPSNQTNGTVYLGKSPGYNNGVKLLNDACSSLYGNIEKGIRARSINIEDIENYMTEDAKTGSSGAYSYAGLVTYRSQVGDAYVTAESKYPIIYAEEKMSVIDGIKKETGLDLSDMPEKFIERTDKGATDGTITPSIGIQPYQTYWYKDETYMSTAFKDYTKKDSTTANYYELIIPKGNSTSYWVASRSINTESSYCSFYMRCVLLGTVNARNMFFSDSCALFPVITLSARLIEGDATSGFKVQ